MSSQRSLEEVSRRFLSKVAENSETISSNGQNSAPRKSEYLLNKWRGSRPHRELSENYAPVGSFGASPEAFKRMLKNYSEISW